MSGNIGTSNIETDKCLCSTDLASYIHSYESVIAFYCCEHSNYSSIYVLHVTRSSK